MTETSFDEYLAARTARLGPLGNEIAVAKQAAREQIATTVEAWINFAAQVGAYCAAEQKLNTETGETLTTFKEFALEMTVSDHHCLHNMTEHGLYQKAKAANVVLKITEISPDPSGKSAFLHGVHIKIALGS
jgi:hypothetical protein